MTSSRSLPQPILPGKRPLPLEFYARDPVEVARDLLGKILWRQTAAGLTAGRIVETEAYLSQRDSACHAAAGLTRKNATMFGPAGKAYVYVIHARFCFNIVTEGPGQASAVLIRALEPLVGLELMRKRRMARRSPGTKLSDRDLCRGPARLCEALAITRTDDGQDLSPSPAHLREFSENQIWLESSPPFLSPSTISRSRRIGVTSAQHRLLRFYLRHNLFLSGPISWS